MKSIVLLTAVIVFLAILNSVNAAVSTVKFAWSAIDFNWSSPAAKSAAIQNGDYVTMNNMIFGVTRWNNYLFVTNPRWFSNGIPASLAYINLMDTSLSPKLTPYPNWQAHNINQLNVNDPTNPTIISAFRMQVDACNRLWVLDVGVNDISSTYNVLSAPALLIYDLPTNKLIKRYQLPAGTLKDLSFFVSVTVDVDSNNCANAFAYLADVGSYSVVVYSLKTNRSWRVSHNYFYFEPQKGYFDFGGSRIFNWPDGVFSLALSEKRSDGSKLVYFHPYASTKEFTVPNTVLQSETYSQSFAAFQEFQFLGDRGCDTRSTMSVYDSYSKVLFLANTDKNAINCYDTTTCLNPSTLKIFDIDQEALQFPSDIKLDSTGNLWMVSSKLPKHLYSQLTNSTINFRILTRNIRVSGALADCY